MSATIGSLALDELEGIEGIQRYATRIALEPLFNFSHGAGMLSEDRFPLETTAMLQQEAVLVKGKITVSF